MYIGLILFYPFCRWVLDANQGNGSEAINGFDDPNHKIRSPVSRVWFPYGSQSLVFILLVFAVELIQDELAREIVRRETDDCSYSLFFYQPFFSRETLDLILMSTGNAWITLGLIIFAYTHKIHGLGAYANDV